MIESHELSESDIQANYEEFIAFVKKAFTGDRQEKLLQMYSEGALGVSAAISPASMNEHWHLAHPGGYLQHIMHVIKLSFSQMKVFEDAGCTIDWTVEEMIFAAMHHDLGKLGDPQFGDYYDPNVEDWRRKRGEKYKMNGNLPYMEVTDRAVYLLQKYGVEMTWKEYLGIKLADGIYNEASKKYLIQFNPELFLKTNLPRVIHLADYTACVAERSAWDASSKSE
jgi:hypothetical protein